VGAQETRRENEMYWEVRLTYILGILEMSKVTYILGWREYIIIKRNNTDISSFYDKEVVPITHECTSLSKILTYYILLNIHQQCE
jgi:hypothetical protein